MDLHKQTQHQQTQHKQTQCKQSQCKQTQHKQTAELTQLLDHPDLWRAKHLSSPGEESQGLATGYAELDTHLPGNGWPNAGLVEFLLSSAGIGELRLLVPTLKALSQYENRWIAWVNPPFIPYAPALASIGIDVSKILLIHPTRNSKSGISGISGISKAQQDKRWQDTMWSLERAAKSGSCSAVLAWVDEKRLGLRETQRLQNAAKQGQTLTCLMRPDTAAQQASMAELRIQLHCANQPGTVSLDILKRRGGWPVSDLLLPIAETTGTQHRNVREIHEQLTLWRAEMPEQSDPEVNSTKQPLSKPILELPQDSQHPTLH
ncbi:MAG: translesion DNA synthesis-associated protein ImuA [Pseudomonadota bacterium]